jgi:shikimate dehydrogenase
MIGADTALIAHIGYPTHAFKSPYIYNPHFESTGVDAVVMPMSCRSDYFPALLHSLFSLDNIRGALITMPHKITTVDLLRHPSKRVAIAGSCNAVRRHGDGTLEGDMFDGEGFVRGVRGKGVQLVGASALVVGCGGVGCAIVASLAAAGVRHLSLFDTSHGAADRLRRRLQKSYPELSVQTGSNDPAGYDLVVNATPMGMNPDDPLPLDVTRLDPATFVGEVIMKQEMTAFLEAAAARGCRYQVGTDMLFEMIPAYLDFFGFPAATAEQLKTTARL